MKRFIISVIFVFVAISSFAQIAYQKPVKSDYEWLCGSSILHSFSDDDYTLYIPASSSVDDSTPISLGTGKDVAKQSLNALYQMLNEAKVGENIVINGKKYEIRNTSVQKSKGKGEYYTWSDGRVEELREIYYEDEKSITAYEEFNVYSNHLSISRLREIIDTFPK